MSEKMGKEIGNGVGMVDVYQRRVTHPNTRSVAEESGAFLCK